MVMQVVEADLAQGDSMTDTATLSAQLGLPVRITVEEPHAS